MPPSMKAARAWSRTCAICASRPPIWRAVRPAPWAADADAGLGQRPAGRSAASCGLGGAAVAPGCTGPAGRRRDVCRPAFPDPRPALALSSFGRVGACCVTAPGLGSGAPGAFHVVTIPLARRHVALAAACVCHSGWRRRFAQSTAKPTPPKASTKSSSLATHRAARRSLPADALGATPSSCSAAAASATRCPACPVWRPPTSGPMPAGW